MSNNTNLKKGFVVPVSRVGKILVPESDLNKYPLSTIHNTNESEQENSL